MKGSLERVQAEYKPVEYPPTSEILAKIKAFEAEIGKELAELEEMRSRIPTDGKCSANGWRR